MPNSIMTNSTMTNSTILKKAVVLILSISLVFSLCSCGASKTVKKLQDDLSAFSTISHASIKFISIYKKGDTNQKQTTTLSYQFDDKDVLTYCLSQYDAKDNLVYYEVNDGNTHEEWLLGKGATSYSKEDKSFPVYTKSNPHKYLSIIQSISNNEYIKKCKLDDSDTAKIYSIKYDNKKINKKIYSEENYKVENKQNTVTFNDKSDLTNILEEVTLIDNDKKPYGSCVLDIAIEYSKVAPTIKKPDLK